MRKLVFHPDIKIEIKESYQWYESNAEGLGEDFIAELESGFKIIKESPDIWPAISINFKRYLLNRFPFGIIYQMQPDCIYIVAVMHLKRNPGYWTKRVES